MSMNKRLRNKKHTKINKGENLVRDANNTQIRREKALAGDDLSNTHGPKSYAEIAITQGLYDDIAEFIKLFVEGNPYFNQAEIMDAVKNEFPTVFGGYKSKYSTNFYKILEKDPLWCESLKVSNVLIQRAIMQTLYKRAVKGIETHQDDKGKYYEIGMKDRDMIEFVRLTAELEDRARSQLDKAIVSSETSSTLDEINQGLKELGGGDIGTIG